MNSNIPANRAGSVSGNRPGVRAAAAPAVAQTQTSGAPKVLPQFILKYKDADGTIKSLTGLFESVSKKGQTYFSGKDRESGVTYYVMTNDKAAK
jgi:hypothetical protein